MNNSIKLKLLFDENIERENQKFFFRYTWKKVFTEIKKAVMYTILFLSLGFIPIDSISNTPIAVIFKFGGFLFLGYIFFLLYQYFTNKKKTDKLVEEQISEFKQENGDLYFIDLNKDNITIGNPFNIISSVWNKTTYKFIEKYLIVGFLNNKINFIFTEAVFEKNDYKVLVDFLQKNSKEEK